MTSGAPGVTLKASRLPCDIAGTVSSWPGGAPLTAICQPYFRTGPGGPGEETAVRRITRAALTLAAAASTAAALAGVAGGPAAAKTYPPPRINLLCATAPVNGAVHGSICALPFGQTTAPNAYSQTIAASRVGNAGATVTFAVTAGSLPPGLALGASSGTSAVISGNPTQAGTFNFTIKATDGGLTSTLAYQITITVKGPPDQLLCSAANGSFLSSGVCLLPDATVGVPYQQGQLVTSHGVGGALTVVSGSLPPGLSLPATFAGSGDTVSGTPGQPGVEPNYVFTVQGTGDQGQPLYQAYSIMVDPNQPLAINASGGTDLGGTVGQAFAQDFFVSGGAAPYTWSVASGRLPPGLTLQSPYGPRDAGDELAGTPATAGTYTFTMKLSDYDGQQATQQFTLTIDAPLQITSTLPAGTVGVPYSHDLIATGGAPPYSWFVVNNINELPPGLTLGSTAPDFNNVLTGTPTQAGTFSFPMQVQDSQDNTVSGTVTVTINP
jgi:large repetitive protein